jgi:CheY-like chemotaxis protein/HPt (histidine-containing phosphotransfer) domain-containing protein
MWVESTVGQGSTFHFSIRAQSAPGPKRAYLQEVEPQLAGRRLLVVDDNATNRRILQLQAEAWGLTCCAFASPHEALEELCLGKRFDLAILDMQMPEMDGLALAAAFRRLQGQDELPIILLTSLGGLDAEQRQTALTLSLAATLSKPVKPSQLYETLVSIYAESISVGRRVHVQPQATARPAGFDAAMGRRLPLRILLVDDNGTNQKLGVRLLERLGYRADVVANGAEALEALRRQPHDRQYQVVLMDVQMPVMDGLEATQHIRRAWPADVQPYIIAMTANALADEQEACRAARMDDYVGKPIRVEALVEALQRAAAAVHPVAQDAILRHEAAVNPVAQDIVLRHEAESSPAQEEAIGEAALARLQEMMGGDPAHLQDLIDGFLQDAPQLLTDLRRGLETGDAAGVRLAAHSLKSNAADFGANRLAEQAQALEQIAKTGQLDGVAELVTKIEDATVRVQCALQNRRGAAHATDGNPATG